MSINRRSFLSSVLAGGGISAGRAKAETPKTNRLCQFGVELPYNVADPFLTKPERFFSCRLMPPGSAIPRSPHGPREMARRLTEMGADFVGYGMHYDDLDAAFRAADWASAHGFGLMLNNPICQINAPRTPGFQTWVYPPDLLTEVGKRARVVGAIYDELIHHQVHPGLKGHTNPWNALADVSNCRDPLEAYRKVEQGLGDLFAHSAATGVPAFTEQVIPALFHAVARAGGRPGCKVLKEQVTPVSLSLCMSAARQYNTDWYATVDLWEGDSGPWYQIMGRFSGHSPAEYLSALKLMALLNPCAAMSESADVLWVIDSRDAELTEFGETFLRFRREIRPRIRPAFDVSTWQPDVAFVHSEDGCYRKPDLGFLLGCRNLPVTPQSAKWLRAWYHLTWGRCSGDSLWNYFDPAEKAIARQNAVGGNEHDFERCPRLPDRRNPARKQTHMHSLFTPLNNVAVYDGYVSPRQLEGVGLVILCGAYCESGTHRAVRAAVEAGARCLCQEECAPPELRQASGQQLGKGYWWTVPDFDAPAAIEQFLRVRGYHNQWILRSGLGTLRIHSTDRWGNEIDWELERA